MAALLREVASAVCAEVGGSFSLIKISLPQSRHKVVPAPPEEEPTIKMIFSRLSRNPSVGCAASVSLRLGHVAALTVHRTVIHYRADTSLPYRGAETWFLLKF